MNKGERIKALRESAGYSQVELAELLDVSKQTLYKYENNIITNIPSDKIEGIAKYTHSTPEYIMGWSKKDESSSPDFPTTPHEQTVIKHYRKADSGTKANVCKLLDVPEEKIYRSQSEVS